MDDILLASLRGFITRELDTVERNYEQDERTMLYYDMGAVSELKALAIIIDDMEQHARASDMFIEVSRRIRP